MDISRTLLVTHRGCMDGSGCAIMFLRAGGDISSMRYIAAGGADRWLREQRNLDLLGDRSILMVDVAPSSPDAVEAIERRGNFTLLDHHRSADVLSGRPWATVDEAACGTELLRRHLGLDDDDSRCLAETIDDFDRWQNRLDFSEDLADLHVFLGQRQFIERFVWPRAAGGEFITDEEDKLVRMIRRRKSEEMAMALAAAVRSPFQICGASDASAVVLVTDCPYTSHLLDQALRAHPEAQLAVQVAAGRRSVSLRSRPGGVDVSTVARRRGGGGHPTAAGFPIAKETIAGLVEEILG